MSVARGTQPSVKGIIPGSLDSDRPLICGNREQFAARPFSRAARNACYCSCGRHESARDMTCWKKLERIRLQSTCETRRCRAKQDSKSVSSRATCQSGLHFRKRWRRCDDAKAKEKRGRCTRSLITRSNSMCSEDEQAH